MTRPPARITADLTGWQIVDFRLPVPGESFIEMSGKHIGGRGKTWGHVNGPRYILRELPPPVPETVTVELPYAAFKWLFDGRPMDDPDAGELVVQLTTALIAAYERVHGKASE